MDLLTDGPESLFLDFQPGLQQLFLKLTFDLLLFPKKSELSALVEINKRHQEYGQQQRNKSADQHNGYYFFFGEA